MEVVELSVDYGGRRLTLQTGKLAKQADASVLVTYGETMVLVNVCSSKELKENQDFFPLTVDYQEKYYAAGRLPGGFFKREAKPSDRATLSARMIDRPSRPLFPEDFLCDTFITATVLSVDGVNEADIAASIGASAALHMSDIPWGGPFAACRVGHINGEFVVNPSPADAENSRLEILVAALKTGVVMVEGSAKEVTEAEMVEALDFAHKAIMPILELQDELRKKAGKPKREYPKPAKNEALKKEMKTALLGDFKKAFAVKQKLERYEALAAVKTKAKEKFAKKDATSKEDLAHNKLVSVYLEELKATYARDLTLNSGHRIDGRDYKDIRPITCDINLLPRVHGSALFTRGETQVLGTVTLGTSDDEQKIDSINGIYNKSFLLHYNFPPYSVGEARPLRPPGRREVGHGFLAERALAYVIPSKEVFPYTIRLVSEVLESNGSSSMATVCSGSMALMQAGVPIPKAVAGVAMGLIKEDDKYRVLSDILGDEDHLGDMDFKVCGTADGITAFQMDLKIGGVSREIMTEALDQAKEGRLHILGKMNEAISAPATDFSQYAPRIFTIKVRPDKVREVIGSGGKVVRGIIEKTGVKIDIEDDGTIHIASVDQDAAKKAIEMIENIVQEAEPGKIYEGRVSRIAEFGAFIEIIPGTDGLCHISELDHYRVRRVEDVVKEGDMVKVKCLEVDPSGKIRLSRKALLPKNGGDGPSKPEGDRGDRGPRPERSERVMREPSAADAAAEGTPDVVADPVTPEGGDRPERSARSERPERTDRPERSERSDRPTDRPERSERPERTPRGPGADFDAEDTPGNERFPADRGGRDRDRGIERDRGGDRDRAPAPDYGNRRSSSEGRSSGGGGGGRGRDSRGGGGGRSSGGRDDNRGNRGGGGRPMGGGGGGRSEGRGPSRSAGGDRDRGGYRSEGGGNDRGGRGGYDRGPERAPERNGNYDRPERGGYDRPERSSADRGPERTSERTPERAPDRAFDRGYDRDRGNDRGNERRPERDRSSSSSSSSETRGNESRGNEAPREGRPERGPRHFDRDRASNAAPAARPRRENPNPFEEPEFQPRDYREEPLGYPPSGDDEDR